MFWKNSLFYSFKKINVRSLDDSEAEIPPIQFAFNKLISGRKLHYTVNFLD